MGSVVIGLSLGRTAESSGLAVVEAVEAYDEKYSTIQEYHVRELRSFRPGAGYTPIIEHVNKVCRKVAVACVVVDQTAVGAPIVELIKKGIANPLIPIIIGGQHTEHYSNGLDYIPKQILISQLIALLTKKTLKIFKDLAEAANLTQELLNYENRPTSSSSLNGDIWREQPCDDLIFALALACWQLQKPPGFEYEFM
jgi:hypothetical protein